KSIVAKVRPGENLRASLETAISLLGPLSAVVAKGDRVLVKPNFNSPDPFPASSDLGFIRAVVEVLLDAGARVVIGESSGGVWRPTRKVFEIAGIYGLANELGVGLIPFEDRADWVRVRINGEYLKTVTMPASAYEADRLVYLPCMKTHYLGRFSGAMKLAFGFVHPGERRGFHMGHLEEKLAEVNLCWQPDLVITDGRKAFVTGGPSSGDVVEPGIVLASGDQVAIDVEAVRVLLSYGARNRLTDDPCEMGQIAEAAKHSLGSATGYLLME
ncbi:MAG: DUF362 domain-containing protein, partial [Dehalococcoidia bacterium]|nr:DUF362 domain-containing protein [Dehalococcoidia bacterium]